MALKDESDDSLVAYCSHGWFLDYKSFPMQEIWKDTLSDQTYIDHVWAWRQLKGSKSPHPPDLQGMFETTSY